jgi:hypothetical protein
VRLPESSGSRAEMMDAGASELIAIRDHFV